MANEGLGWDSLLKMVHNPGGDWNPGWGVDLKYNPLTVSHLRAFGTSALPRKNLTQSLISKAKIAHGEVWRLASASWRLLRWFLLSPWAPHINLVKL